MSDAANPPSATLLREASRWAGVMDGQPTAEEREAHLRWLARDPRHAAAWAQLQATTRALDRLQAYRPPPDAGRPRDVALGRVTARVHARRRRRRVTWGAATALVMLCLGFWASGVAGLRGGFEQRVATAVGEVRTVGLPDGSSVQLNTDSQAHITYGRGERRVELTSGEAHFSVEHDSRRPFVVATPSASVRAVGTAFSVRVHTAAMEVVVTEGRVGLVEPESGNASAAGAGSAAPVLEVGHRAWIASGGGPTAARARVSVLSPAELAQHLAWQGQRLEFGPTPLARVIDEFNRYSAVKLVLTDPELAELSIGGSFRTGDWETLLRLLEENFDVAAERQEREIRLRRRPHP